MVIDKEAYLDHCKVYNQELESTKCDYYSSQLRNCDDSSFFKAVDSICNTKSERSLPAYTWSSVLADQFAEFFSKVGKIREDLDKIQVDIQPPEISLHVTRRIPRNFYG